MPKRMAWPRTCATAPAPNANGASRTSTTPDERCPVRDAQYERVRSAQEAVALRAEKGGRRGVRLPPTLVHSLFTRQAGKTSSLRLVYYTEAGGRR